MLKPYISLGCLIFVAATLISYSQLAYASPEIIGAPKCKSCHKAKTGDQWKAWTESAHAGAFETLSSDEAKKIAADKGLGDPQAEVACLKCHATRVFLGTGVAISEKAKYTDSEGVGCEACHGPGSDYKPKNIMTDPEAARAAGMVSDRSLDACAGCHNEESPTFMAFDFEESWAKIAHPVPLADAVETTTDLPGEIIFESSVGQVHFPHDLHVEELELECGECHHQIHAAELDTPHPDYMKSSWIKCQICHETNSAMSEQYYSCSDCHHSDLENIADETLSSKVVIHKNCWACHESGTGVTASHGCLECHLDEKK